VTGFLFLQNTSTFNNGWSATGPGGRWGTGFATAETGSTGNSTLLLWNNIVYLDSAYVSGSPLTGTMTFEGYTYEEAGLIPGNYTWTLAGSGDTVVMQVAAIPEPSTYAMALAGIACGGFSTWRRRKRA